MSSTEFDARAATAALRLEYVARDRLESRPMSWWRNVLGVVGFERPPAVPAGAPIAMTLTPMLGGHTDLCEVWRLGDADAHAPLSSGRLGRMQYRFNEEVLFGCLSIDERDVLEVAPGDPNAKGGAEALLRAAEIAYEEVFAVLEATQHRHLVRIWNYLPEINVAAAGEERYRLFNSARQAAFRKSGRAVIGSVPAACALGSPAGARLCVYLLAARHPSMTIENPRQTSAYHYPPKFGKHSPTFSRACIYGGARHANLFISGTASIVGHETIHHGDAEAQTRETLANINALLDEANRISGGKRYFMNTLKLKVYVRRPADLPAIQAIVARESSAESPLYLKADICREDLLVEIEATGEASIG
jgi:chorismate lyase / 3-hydroxybenzoate synthase